MSGHSKWHSIKHKKAATDARRGKAFTKLIKEITVAARTGGGDPEGNARLRKAISDAKAVNMPADNIKRAVMKGTGELDGGSIEEIMYEGYGPGGAALMVEVMTDNRNRTVSEVRHLFDKYGGNLGENGCVAWMFSKRGYILIPAQGVEEEAAMSAAIEAGADDFSVQDDAYEILTTPDAFESVLETLGAQGFQPTTAEVSMVPQSYIKLEGRAAQQMVKLMDALDDHDDVQNVHANFDIEESELAGVAG
jgi:YebC/PmpR family DNA-binding regulatory protein